MPLRKCAVAPALRFTLMPFAVRAAWYVVNAILFRSSLFGLAPSRAKAHILRLFGARVGRGVVIKPRVDIKSPWFLTLGDHVWLGERVWIDNHTEVTLGSNVCVSQGAYIFTGNHDWSNPAFPFFCKKKHCSRCRGEMDVSDTAFEN